MELITTFLGRFHPLLVHLPIGILMLAFIFEMLSWWEKFKELRAAVQPALLLGALSAVLAALTGYFLSLEGGYDDRVLALHQNLGIATALFSVALYLVRGYIIPAGSKPNQKKIHLGLFGALVILLSFTGHMGGSLTHGEDYLSFEILTAPDAEKSDVNLEALKNPDEAILYADVIQPLLDSKCYSCHSSKKQKGQLRLDGIEFIRRGGKNGPVVSLDMPDSSSLYHRLVLPIEDEKHMPPRGKAQLSSASIDLIRTWITDGARTDKKIAAYNDRENIKKFLASFQTDQKKESWLPREEILPADAKAIQQLTARGALVMPVGGESNYLSVNFINVQSFDKKDAELLLPLKQHVVWLNLGRKNVQDEDLKIVGQLSNLNILYLDYTPVTDEGIRNLSTLSNMRYLNLVGTEITDKAVAVFSEMKALEELFLYKTKVSKETIQTLRAKHPSLLPDTGKYLLPDLPTDTIVYKRGA
jgi:uncharacterized membrane protein